MATFFSLEANNNVRNLNFLLLFFNWSSRVWANNKETNLMRKMLCNGHCNLALFFIHFRIWKCALSIREMIQWINHMFIALTSHHQFPINQLIVMCPLDSLISTHKCIPRRMRMIMTWRISLIRRKNFNNSRDFNAWTGGYNCVMVSRRDVVLLL